MSIAEVVEKCRSKCVENSILLAYADVSSALARLTLVVRGEENLWAARHAGKLAFNVITTREIMPDLDF